jgi:hypothetical protein
VLLSLREVKSWTKHVNTCLDDFRAPARIKLRVISHCYMDRGRLFEFNGVKNIL